MMNFYWMILNQFGRRNLSNYQRSVLALELEDVFSKKAKEKQKEAGGAVRQKSDKAVIETNIALRRYLRKANQYSSTLISAES